MPLRRFLFVAGNYAERVSFAMDLQVSLELRTNQDGKHAFMHHVILHTHPSPENFEHLLLILFDKRFSHNSYEFLDIHKKKE